MALKAPRPHWQSTDEESLFCPCLDSKRDMGLQACLTFLEKGIKSDSQMETTVLDRACPNQS